VTTLIVFEGQAFLNGFLPICLHQLTRFLTEKAYCTVPLQHQSFLWS